MPPLSVWDAEQQGTGSAGTPFITIGDQLIDPTSALFSGVGGGLGRKGAKAALTGLENLFGNTTVSDPIWAHLRASGPKWFRDTPRRERTDEELQGRFWGMKPGQQLRQLEGWGQTFETEDYSRSDLAAAGMEDVDQAAYNEAFTAGNLDDINAFLGTLGSTDLKYASVGVDDAGQIGFKGDPNMSPELLAGLFGEGGEFQQYQIDQAAARGMIQNPDYNPEGPVEGDVDSGINTTDQFIADPTLLTQDTSEDFLAALDVGPEVGTQTLDELYAGNDALAMADWGRFMNSLIDPNDPAQGTQRDFFSAGGMVLPEFDQRGILIPGNVDAANAGEAIKAFGEWKVTNDTAVELQVTKDAAAEDLGVPSWDLVDDGEGGFVPDPDKYVWQVPFDEGEDEVSAEGDISEDADVSADGIDLEPEGEPGEDDTEGKWVLKGGEPGVAGLDPETTLGSEFTDFFGEGAGKKLFDTLLEGSESPEEIKESFKEFWGPEEVRFETEEIPEAQAAATMRAGGFLGSAQKEATSRAEARRDASRISAYRQYHNEAVATNLAIYSKALETVETVGDYTKSLAQVGKDVAASNLMIQQARSMEADSFIQLALGKQQYDLLTLNIEGADLDNMLKIFHLAAAEQQIDVNAMMQAQQWYMNNYMGAFGDPLMATYMALADMTTFQNVNQPNTIAPILGSLIEAGGQYLGRPSAAPSAPSASPSLPSNFSRDGNSGQIPMTINSAPGSNY